MWKPDRAKMERERQEMVANQDWRPFWECTELYLSQLCLYELELKMDFDSFNCSVACETLPSWAALLLFNYMCDYEQYIKCDWGCRLHVPFHNEKLSNWKLITTRLSKVLVVASLQTDFMQLICILVCLLLPRRGPADSSCTRHHEAASLAWESREITLHHSQQGWAAEEMYAATAETTAETG